MATAKDYHSLTSYYIKQYKEKFGIEPVVNRNIAKWGWESILMDLDMSETKSLIDFYLTTNAAKKWSLKWFLNNYDSVIQSMRDFEQDAKRRKKLREESEERARKWRESGKRGITSD